MEMKQWIKKNNPIARRHFGNVHFCKIKDNLHNLMLQLYLSLGSNFIFFTLNGVLMVWLG